MYIDDTRRSSQIKRFQQLDSALRVYQFKSLTEAIDTTAPGGRLIFHSFGALAESERNLMRERTMAGLSAARDRGHIGGRPSTLTAAKKQQANNCAAMVSPCPRSRKC
ncbi:recombinase family protein [Rhodococcus erythropolis]|uniref:recombinase family protein n=1 Tax=Rhodococcus erythropolis TaxID=1833 RepID=UPI002949D5D5|nr:recombinase family protein [Rhodococcus erythropolis]MDV6278616.1 recombinase family protein [Rhodococcus erythropolis]